MGLGSENLAAALARMWLEYFNVDGKETFASKKNEHWVCSSKNEWLVWILDLNMNVEKKQWAEAWHCMVCDVWHW